MKKTIIILAAITLSSVQIFCQTNINTAKMIPLKVGRENPPVQFETLLIEPVNLYVKTKPWDDPSVPIQLELNVMQNDTKYAIFLGYHYDTKYNYNYLKAFENYLFGLKINNESVALTVEKLDFGKEFLLELNQKAVIGNFSVFFESSTSEWYVDHDNNYSGSGENLYILLSDGNEQKELRIRAIYESGSGRKLMIEGEDDLQITWKNYQISVLAADEKILKLKVLKITNH